jgi:TldD protein
MLENKVFQEVINTALKTGGDFAEIYIEEAKNNTILMTDGKIENALSGKDYGAGIRIYSGFKSVYAYTNDVSREGLLKTASDAAEAISGLNHKNAPDFSFLEYKSIHPFFTIPSEVEIGRKTDHVKNAYKTAKE